MEREIALQMIKRLSWGGVERKCAIIHGLFGYHVLFLLILKPFGGFWFFVLLHIICLQQGYYLLSLSLMQY